MTNAWATRASVRAAVFAFLACVSPLQAREQTSPALARESAIAAEMLAESDATGLNAALVRRAIEVLGANPDAAAKATLFKDVAAVAERARAAQSPAAILTVLDSPEGRRQGLLSRVAPWNPDTVQFGGPEIDLTILRRRLLAESVALDAADLDALIGALTGDVTPSRARRAIAALTPPDQRDTVQALIDGVVAGRPDPAAIARASQRFVDSAAQEAAKRNAELRTLLTRVANPSRELQRSGVGGLMRGDVSTRSLMAGAGLIEGMARTFGNAQLADDIAHAQKQVRSAMQMYEGLKLLKAGLTGGAPMAVFSLLSGSAGFGADNESAQTAQLTAAIADLTNIVKTEFAKVNVKLDVIQQTLDDIARELKDVKHIALATQQQINSLQADVRSLLAAMPDFEQSVKQLSINLQETKCAPYRLRQISTAPPESLFFECLSVYRTMAAERMTLAGLADGDGSWSLTRSFPSDDRRPLSEMWPGAWLIAKGASDWLGAGGAARFAVAPMQKNLSSGAFLANGLSQYLDWIERYGAPYSQSGALQKDAGSLRNLLADANAQDDFRRSLLPPVGQRTSALKKFAESMGAVTANPSDVSAAAGRIKAALDRALLNDVLKARVQNMKKANFVIPAVQVPVCDGSPITRNLPAMTGAQLLQAGLPENALYFGVANSFEAVPLPGSGGFSTMNVGGYGRDVIGHEGGGFYLCAYILAADDIGAHDDRVIDRRVVVQIKLRLNTAQPCDATPYEWHFDSRNTAAKAAAPHQDVMISGAVAGAIKRCFAAWSPQTKLDWFGDLPARYLEDADSDMINGSMFREIADGHLTLTDIETVVRESSEKLAFLRGYLRFAYPSLDSALTPRISALVFGSRLDTNPKAILDGLTCAGESELLLRQENADRQEFFFRKETLARCRSRRVVLGIAALADFTDFADGRGHRIADEIASVDWDAIDSGNVTVSTWVGRRLQNFLENGATKAYWDSLPKRN